MNDERLNDVRPILEKMIYYLVKKQPTNPVNLKTYKNYNLKKILILFRLYI